MSGKAPESGDGQLPTEPPERGAARKVSSDVFVSYASKDGAVADAIVKALERQGLRCWIAPRNVTPGEFYADAIIGAINATQVVVLVLTESACGSPHVLREIERASAKRHPIVSFRIDATPLPAGLEYFLSASHWLDATISGLDSALHKLTEAVQRLVTSAPVIDSGHASSIANPVADLFPRPPVGTPRNAPLSRPLVASVAVIAVLLAYVAVDRFWLAKHATTGRPVATLASPGGLPTSAIPEKSIAVLPFVDMSEKKDQEYFSDGLSEELLNVLSKVPELRVAARTSAFSFKGSAADIPTIARRLLVAHVLEGSVRKSGNHLRITVQLVQADNGYHLWSETYDRKFEDIFAIQDEIAGAVVKALKLSLFEQARPRSRQTDPKAYALYMQARYLNDQGTASSLEQSIALIREALAIDPAYATAWVLLASAYSNQALRGMRPADDGYRLARDAANKAAAIDPGLAAAYVYLGIIALEHDRDLAAAARNLGRAATLEPASINVMDLAAGLADSLGRVKEAVALYEYIVTRDPANPSAHGNLGVGYLYGGRLDEAIASWRTALKLSPSYEGLQYDIGMALLLKGDREAALATIQQEHAESWRLIGLAMAYHSLGRTGASDAALAELIAKFGPEWPYNIAQVFAWRGEADRAFEWLSKALAIKDTGLNYIVVEPYFTRIHGDPRWPVFLRTIGMLKEQLGEIPFAIEIPGV